MFLPKHKQKKAFILSILALAPTHNTTILLIKKMLKNCECVCMTDCI